VPVCTETDTQGCCNGTSYNKLNLGCCDGSTYNLLTQGCCDGTIYNSLVRCCTDGVVGKCPATPKPTVVPNSLPTRPVPCPPFNSLVRECCGGTVIAYSATQAGCCDGTIYDPLKYGCSGGELLPLTLPHRPH
jgi:hypothetical protein